MKFMSPFDHRPDPALGTVLRDLLTPSDHDAFVAGVMARVRDEGIVPGSEDNRTDWWDVLSAWTRPGLAAASIVAALAVAGWFGHQEAVPGLALEDTLTEVTYAEDESASLLVSADPPDLNVILVSGVNGSAFGR